MKKSGQLVRVAFGKEVNTNCKIGTLIEILNLLKNVRKNVLVEFRNMHLEYILTASMSK